MDRLSAESLRWTLGPYCAFVGAFMLVAPHRFASPVYTALAPYRGLWGMSALVAGVALLAVAILRPRPAVVLLGHGLAGATLLALSASFLQNRAWMGTIAYGVLGAGTILAGTLPRASRAGRDLFALLMGLVAVLQGLLLAGLPVLLGTSYFDVMRPHLRVIGLALALGGGLVVSAHLRRNRSAAYVWAAHLAGGAAFLSFGLIFSLPNLAWTGLALYWGCGLALTLLPWLSRQLAALDPASLRTRLAFSLTTATSVALVLTAAVATSQEERLATEQVLEMRKVEAQLIARNVADYVQLSGARAAVVATLAGRMPMTPVFQRALLEASRPSYPDVTGFVTLDAAGTVLASIGKVPLDIGDWRRLASDTAADLRRPERRGGIPVDLVGTERLLLLLSAPIHLEDGRMGGVLVSAFDAELLARRLARTGSTVYLADGYGRLIASRQDTDVPLPSLPAGWDRELRLGQVPAMARRIAAFERVPGLDWVVAVERPQAAALAGVRRGRDLAFALLLVVVPLAVIGGIIVAGLIARPLGALASAVDEMASGNPALPAIPLETSGITEVAGLAAAFQEMRGRLAVRTRESERLATELRARADALAETDRRKDEFLAMLAHELRNPLGAIANAAHVMDQIGTTQPPVQRAVGVIQRQIQHLVRLVDDLLDVSRITRGKIDLRLEPVDLRDAVRSAVEMTRPIVEAKEHALRVDLPPERLSVHADVTRLEQVLGNLVRNAAKYTEPGGRIEVTAWSEDGEAAVRVRDNGIGIPPELLPRIFDLFIQGEQSLDRSGGGLGIGLTLVHRLVEMHGGQVAAQSGGEGQGSEFTVRIPLAPQDLKDTKDLKDPKDSSVPA
ncbi:MAG TPA: sensor histidine kinase [Thermoanaerobaculia bacterium]|nr:sensor histidine kinase [Thermoanaerobaculia bacterium]